MKNKTIDELYKIALTSEFLTDDEVYIIITKITYDKMLVVAKKIKVGMNFFEDESVLYCKKMALESINKERVKRGLIEINCFL